METEISISSRSTVISTSGWLKLFQAYIETREVRGCKDDISWLALGRRSSTASSQSVALLVGSIAYYVCMLWHIGSHMGRVMAQVDQPQNGITRQVFFSPSMFTG